MRLFRPKTTAHCCIWLLQVIWSATGIHALVPVNLPPFSYVIASTTRLFQSNVKNANSDTIKSIPQIEGITLKMAIDMQGGVADRSEEKSERFTCGASLDMVHRLRRDCQAVLVGKTTVEIDDCTLTVRRVPMLDQQQRQPVRVVLDPRQTLRLQDYKIATDGLDTIIYHCKKDSENKPGAMECSDQKFSNVKWVGLDATESGRLSATSIWENLRQDQGISHLMVEGGPATAKEFLKEGLVDRAILVQAPVNFVDPVPSGLSDEDYETAGLEQIGTGSLDVDQVTYWSRPGLPWPKEPCSEWP